MSAERSSYPDKRDVRTAIKGLAREMGDARSTTEQLTEEAARRGFFEPWLDAQFTAAGRHEFVRKCLATYRDAKGRRVVEIFPSKGLDGIERQLVLHRDFETPEHGRAILRGRHRGLRADERRARDVVDVVRELHGVDLLAEEEFAVWAPIYEAFAALPSEMMSSGEVDDGGEDLE